MAIKPDPREHDPRYIKVIRYAYYDKRTGTWKRRPNGKPFVMYIKK